MTTGFDNNHGLCPRRAARGRHELASIFNRLDVQQDRPRRAIKRKVIEQVAKINVELIPDRYYGRKAHRPWCRPFDETRGDGPGLRNQRQIPRRRKTCCKTGIEFSLRYENAEAVGSYEPHTIDTRGALSGLRKRSRSVTQTCREDDRRGAAP